MKFLDNYKYFIGTFLCFVSIFIFNLWENYPLYSTELFEDWKYIYNYHSCFNNTGIKEIDCTLILKSRFVYPEIWLKMCLTCQKVLADSDLINLETQS